ncbi:MAG: diaminopimelate decarboxylase, partial [Planctomycetes bacterium]|nr:diaminopimelate decarboxylase [Planctomycetota bacterium]
LIRPSLYQAYHRIWPTRTPWRELKETEGVICDVVGPICESGDFLAKDRRMTKVKEGDCLAIFSAGAYGFVMSSNYNTRPRAAEVLVDGKNARVVRERETYDNLLGPELSGIA